MRMRNKPALIFFCFLLSAAAVLSGVNIYSQLKEQQKEKEDFMIRRKTYQEPSFFNASETDWTYADITR